MMTDGLGIPAPQEASGANVSFPPPRSAEGSAPTSHCLHETSLLCPSKKVPGFELSFLWETGLLTAAYFMHT